MRDEARVASVLADWIAAREDGEPIEFETLILQHPDLERELRGALAAMSLVDLDSGRKAGQRQDVPERIGPFRILGVLGDGGMGTVYRAVADAPSDVVPQGEVIALKCVHPHLLKSPGFRARLRREAELGTRIRHPNVVRAYGLEEDDAEQGLEHLLAMEHVEGQSLHALRDELERVPEELCRHIALEIAQGLQAIHEAGAVHRDLKPANVVITPDQGVKIMDLGVAWLAEAQIQLSQSGVFLGSLLYAAPEQIQGGAIDGRTDLYALGLLLYVLACGRHPFRSEESAHVIRQHLEVEPRLLGEMNPQISPFFERLVEALMKKSPADRVRSASELSRILEEGEVGVWWRERAARLCRETGRPLRRIHIPRETALYGREPDLNRLDDLYRMASRGEGCVLLLEGEAGIGKTRLVDEFVSLLRQRGEDPYFLFGSYPPGGAATTEDAFSTALREHFGAERLEEALGEVLTTTPRLVPAFAALLRGEPRPADAMQLTRESVTTVFVHATRALASERPTIVFIDDLHFAPEDARSLFTSLTLAVPGHRILLIGSMRPGVPATWLSGLDRMEHVSRHTLSRLGPKDLADLLEDAFQSRRLAEELGVKIGRKADGNPFFAFEIIRGLREGQLIKRSPDGSWVTTQVIEDVEVPSTVLELVNARVADLSDVARDLLDVASCCGFEFDSRVVADVLGLARIPALQMLAKIEKRHRLVRSAGDGFVFDHHQVQEALYQGLSEPLREEYHAAIGGALEAQAGTTDKDPSDLGGSLCVDLCEHFLKGAQEEKALRYLDAALDHLEAGFLNDRALALIDRFLGMRGLVRGARRLGVLLKEAELLDLLGRRDAQEEALAEARALAEAERDATTLAKVERATGGLRWMTGRYEEAKGNHERQLAIAREIGDRQGEANATGNLGVVFRRLGRYEEAKGHLEQHLAIAREIGDRQGEATATGNLGNVYADLGRYEEAKGHAERQLRLAREDGDRRSEARATGSLGSVFFHLGRYEEARGHLEQHLAIAREIGDRKGEATATGNLGNVSIALGRYEEAKDQIERHLAIAREIGDREGEAASAGNLGILFYSLGRYEEARGHFERHLAIAREIGDRQGEAIALVNVGPLWLNLGHPDRGRQALEACLALCREIGARYPEGYALWGLSDAAAQERDPARALQLAEAALGLRREIGHGDCVADSLIQLSEIHWRSGATDEARATLDEAIDLLRQQNRKPQLAHALALLANLGGEAAEAETALEETGDAGNTPATRYYVWKATGKLEHLAEAKRLLDYRIEHAPEEYRESMLKNVRLNREIMEVWAEHGTE